MSDILLGNGEIFGSLYHALLAGTCNMSGASVAAILDDLSKNNQWDMVLTLVDLLSDCKNAEWGDHQPDYAYYKARAYFQKGDYRLALAELATAPESKCDIVSMQLRGMVECSSLRELGENVRCLELAQSLIGHEDIDSLAKLRLLRLLATVTASCLELTESEEIFSVAIGGLGAYDKASIGAGMLADCAQLFYMSGMIDECERSALKAMSIADGGLFRPHMSMSRNGLGIAKLLKGDFPSADRLFGEALRVAEAHEYRAIEALLWLSLADLSFDQGALEEAERRYRRALAISTIVDQPSYVSYALSGLAGVERLRGRFAEAGKLLAEARECIGSEQRYDLAVCSLRKAHLLMDENKLGLALHELDGTITALRDGGALIDLSRGLLMRANTYFLGYGLEAAQPDLAELMGCIQTIGTSQFLAPYCRRMPRLMRALGASPQLKAYASIVGLDAEVPTVLAMGKVTPIARVDDPHPDLLNSRELEVVRGLCEGLSRTELAARVGRSRSTVDKLIHTIYTATGFEATHQIVAWAYRVGLYRPPLRHD